MAGTNITAGTTVASQGPFPDADLAGIVAETREIWSQMRGWRVFLTGGTGFVGRWILESVCRANDVASANISLTVLSRSPSDFLQRFPHLAKRGELNFISGDIGSATFPDERFDAVIHAAAVATNRDEEGARAVATIVDGTRRVLQFACANHIRKFLFVSSGAVYGSQPADVPAWRERDLRADLIPGLYGKCKREAESLCMEMDARLDVTIARCFTFFGPGLQLDAGYAAGDFVRDGLLGKAIDVQGDGKTVRSYMYAADLVIWLLHILVRGETGSVFNVGSDLPVTIADLAAKVAGYAGVEMAIRGGRSPGPVSRYIPNIDKARDVLGLRPKVGLDDAIARTFHYYRFRI